jgi:hypothetical protein
MEETFDKVGGNTRLAQMHCKGQECNMPQKVNSPKPLDNAHEINLAFLYKKMAEEILHSWIYQEKDKVINVKTKSERTCQLSPQ